MAETLNINSDLEEDFFELLEGRLYSERLKEIRKKENISVETLMAIYALGEEFYNRFLMKEAEVIFSAYMALCPYDHRGPGSLASIYLEQGKFNKALEMLNIAKVYPTADFDETILNIALCHYKLKEHNNAAVMLILVKRENLNEYYAKRYDYLKRQLNPYLQ
ncbi:regulator [Vibrio parahaemolyticus]|nr:MULTISPECIES: hypothetical protein [Vibrio]RFD42419.1 regulator [Vibrio parahaemolyticus 3355]EGQ7900615.1 regulator [Vibrio parahaemolyticus]EGQ8513444.1 regulator [Vibrio parahaemolyticus]EGQ8960961.1 regulator [Vibrio parahaemolyticus]EGQ9499099.1 regulator [Vibrio parahaemolyticus]